LFGLINNRFRDIVGVTQTRREVLAHNPVFYGLPY